jgi:hypothetical protein
MRRVRPQLEKEHARILKLDTSKLFDQQTIRAARQSRSEIRALLQRDKGRGVLAPGLVVMGPADLIKHYAACSNDTVARP